MNWRRLLVISAVVVVSLLLLAAAVLFVLWHASQSVPEFYTDRLVADPVSQRTGSDTMIQKATLLASDVQKAGRWETLFTEDEINGWLAVDLKENHGASLPPDMSEPRVALEPGSIHFACRATQGGVDTVLSIALEIYLSEPGVLAIRIRHVRAGAVPLPLSGILEEIRDLGERHALHIQWQQAEGDPVALVRISPVFEDGKHVVIDTVEVAQGEIYASGTTEEPDQ